jgi:serine/threonine protein kinase
LHREIAGDQILRRFHQERQILASLEHAQIARLLDGGVTDDGLHYYVMDVCRRPADRRVCDRRRLSLAARLELFRQVCGAVEHAHRHLVVHCDLKPSNILVTEDGKPKLLDFGIARLLGSRYVPRLVTTTVAGLRQMTPEYASPEQVRGERVTTASDTYSLGVLFYKLMTGRLPYSLEGLTLQEIERVICHQAPPRPSAVVDAPRELRGDLDNIVAMALRKDPARRYPSVEQLSEDLRRHLTGRPVVPRRDTLAYRAGKFVRRHRWGVTATALMASSLLAGLGTSAWMALVALELRIREQAQGFAVGFQDLHLAVQV